MPSTYDFIRYGPGGEPGIDLNVACNFHDDIHGMGDSFLDRPANPCFDQDKRALTSPLRPQYIPLSQ